MSILQLQHIARIFNHHKLHAVAEAEVRNLFFARILNRFYFSFDACFAETAWDDDAVILPERGGGFPAAALYLFCIHPGNLRPTTELRR